ncbi:MAG: hypothetical protein EXQ56_10670 [Acidobacteria bacterium]|nr:hypothetical protein [Acidobacteriota bacterium]
MGGRLKELGVTAWIYSYDRLLATDVWAEIQSKIDQANVFAFLIGEDTPNAQGQKRELALALEKVNQQKPAFELLPLVLNDAIDFNSLPESLWHRNGERLSGSNVKQVAFKIAAQFFPDTIAKWTNETVWRCPRPGDWLEVCRIEGTEVSEYFDLGDKVMFRRLSPMGLFECYAPKIGGLFWFWHAVLRPVSPTDPSFRQERELVPENYRMTTMIDIESLGHDAWRQRNTKTPL